jgi:septum site-determining protein MinC
MNRERTRPRAEAFELDASLAPVTVLRLCTADVARIEKELRARLSSLRHAFPYAAVVIDVGALDEASARELPLLDLVERLRACRLLPVGAANLPPTAVWNAAAASIGVVELAAAPPIVPEPSPVVVDPPPVAAAPPPVAAKPAPVVAEPPPAATLTVRQPVRAGQVIHAHDADLVVLAQVNPGAQVSADGHVHVYGALRGRAVAGAQGRTDARVFCQSLEAELISIAGHVLVAEAIPSTHRGRAAQLYVEESQVRIQPL